MHCQVVAATDLVTVQRWTPKRLMRYHVLLVIRLATREVQLAGVVPEPHASWMQQVARNLTDPWASLLGANRHLIHDRATLFAEQFRQTLRGAKVEALRLPARSPNLSAYAERFVRTIRGECLERVIFFREASLHRALAEFVRHYNEKRNHRGLQNKIIRPEFPEFPLEGEVRCRQALGRLLRYYYREAA
jgi:putative transposase